MTNFRRCRQAVLVGISVIFLGFYSYGMSSHYHEILIKKMDRDPLYKLLGSFKEGLGDLAYAKSDSYFHGGIDVALVGRCRHEEGHAESNEHAFKRHVSDWVYRVNSQVKVTEHRHTEGDETKQILPLMMAALNLNPHNVDAIISSAFMLETYLNQLDPAIEVLKKGIKNNPEAFDIYLALGNIYYLKKKDYALSVLYFKKAIGLMDPAKVGKFTPRITHYCLADSYDRQGNYLEALPIYQKTFSMFEPSEKYPLKGLIQERIKELMPELEKKSNNH